MSEIVGWGGGRDRVRDRPADISDLVGLLISGPLRSGMWPAFSFVGVLLGMVIGAAVLSGTAHGQSSAATQSAPRPAAPVDRVEALLRRLAQPSSTPTELSRSSQAPGAVPPEVSDAEREITSLLEGMQLDPPDAEKLWGLLAEEDNASALKLTVLQSMLAASKSPKSREAFWSELGGLAKEFAKPNQANDRSRSLLGFLERHRDILRPLYEGVRETESSGDEMVDLMLASRIFGQDVNESLVWLVQQNAAAVARRLERERGRGRPVTWENAAFDQMLRWKEAHLVAGAPKAARSLAALDGDGETFVVIFNSLHDFDEKYRKAMLRGLGPVEVFNAAIGGELELYRMGTSSYRDFLHAVIMRGINESGSFEVFLERAAPKAFGDAAARSASGRGMVLLRIVSSFGLLEDVLKAVGDRRRFISDAISSLSDPRAFEGNASVLLDLVTLRAATSGLKEFQRALLSELYERFGTETNPRLRSVYGSILSVYQTMTGDRRVAEIDRTYPLDERMFRIPFDRLFASDGRGGRVHRMFMRFDQDVDASATYASFLARIRSRGATVRHERNFDVYRIASRGRAIEIYANKPTAAGVKSGIPEIAAMVRGKMVHTVIGRGHTAIVTPLQKDARQILGDRIKDVTTVIVGTCGGDASVRDLISTFGYSPFFTTRSTGRQALNNALIDTYITALTNIAPGGRLDLADVLDRTTAPFMRKGADEDLRDDASFYRLSTASVLAAYLFDTHVKPLMATGEAPPTR